MKSIYGVLMRGGTSRGLFLKEPDVRNLSNKDEILIKIFGSGTPSQVDGVGGGFTHTSKVMIVGLSSREGFELEYTFGQVGVDKKIIDWTGNCGNLTAAVAPFAIDEKIIEVKNGSILIRMLNKNTMKRIDAVVPVKDGLTQYEGEYYIDGIPTPGSRIETIWHHPGGAVTGKLLPTGRHVDFINVEGKTIKASLVDAANPAVFVKAEDVGLVGLENPNDIGAETLRKIEKIRGYAARLMGLVDNPEEAVNKSPHLPFVGVVSERKDFRTSDGRYIDARDYDILVRLFSMQKIHHTCAVTAAICIATASRMDGTLVEELTNKRNDTIIIAHPKGLIELKTKVTYEGYVENVTIARTARRIMSGLVYYM